MTERDRTAIHVDFVAIQTKFLLHGQILSGERLVDFDQIDVIEINEAFAPQVLGCLAQLGLADDDTRINPGGGAIALGHPLGASGTRLLLTAARRLQAGGGTYAVVSMCIGLGQGIAAVIQRV